MTSQQSHGHEPRVQTLAPASQGLWQRAQGSSEALEERPGRRPFWVRGGSNCRQPEAEQPRRGTWTPHRSSVVLPCAAEGAVTLMKAGNKQSHLPWRRSSACRSEGETRPLVVGAVTTCCPFWVHTSVPQRQGRLDRSSHPPKLRFRTAHSVLTYLNFHDCHSRACLGPQSLTSKGGGHERSGGDGSVRRPLSASTFN